MGRLTYHNPDGNWGLNNVDIKKVPKELYGAICKLKDYEDTGYSPDEIDELADLCMRLEGADDGLAEYEVLEERGLMLELPCMVGDTVYRINKGAKNPIILMEVHEISLFYSLKAHAVVMQIKCHDDIDSGEISYFVNDIGKTVFLKQEEAEDALKKMEGLKL